MATFEELIETLADEEASSYYQQRAVRELGKLEDERVVEPLISALKAEDRYVKREAAKILGELGFPAAVEPLIEVLGDSEEYVRRNAIVALGILGDERAVEPLKPLLEDKSYSTRSATEKSLQAIQEQNSGPEPVEEPVAEQVVEPEPEPVPPPMPVKPHRAISPEIAAVIDAPPVAEETAEEIPPSLTAAEIHTRAETRKQSFEHRTERPRKVVLYDRKEKNRASSAKPRVTIFAVIAAILVLRIVFRRMPIFILPMLLAFGLFGFLRFLKKRDGK